MEAEVATAARCGDAEVAVAEALALALGLAAPCHWPGSHVDLRR